MHQGLCKCIWRIMYSDSLPEWSKGVDSSSTSASCVGSNPTAVIFAISLMHDETTLMPNSFNAGECVSLIEASISDIIPITLMCNENTLMPISWNAGQCVLPDSQPARGVKDIVPITLMCNERRQSWTPFGAESPLQC